MSGLPGRVLGASPKGTKCEHRVWRRDWAEASREIQIRAAAALVLFDEGLAALDALAEGRLDDSMVEASEAASNRVRDAEAELRECALESDVDAQVDCQCDAVHEIQGETDSFGYESVHYCSSCLGELRRWEDRRRAELHHCDWCGKKAFDVVETRDTDEGSDGPVYMVCGDCRDRQRRQDQEEWDAMHHSHDDWDDGYNQLDDGRFDGDAPTDEWSSWDIERQYDEAVDLLYTEVEARGFVAVNHAGDGLVLAEEADEGCRPLPLWYDEAAAVPAYSVGEALRALVQFLANSAIVAVHEALAEAVRQVTGDIARGVKNPLDPKVAAQVARLRCLTEWVVSGDRDTFLRRDYGGVPWSATTVYSRDDLTAALVCELVDPTRTSGVQPVRLDREVAELVKEALRHTYLLRRFDCPKTLRQLQSDLASVGALPGNDVAVDRLRESVAAARDEVAGSHARETVGLEF